MDLKQNINKTETLKNNVKTINNKINEMIVRGGGITSKSLSEIPDNINKMLGQYSKIAEINLNVDITKTESGSYSGEWTVPISITFEPKFAFLYIMSNNSTSFTWDTRNHMIIRLASNPDIELSEFSITKKQMKFHKNARVTNEYTLKKVTVIG